LLSGRRKLLLADDSPTVRKVVEMFFVEEGYDVVAVGGGAEALRELEAERPPDVLLADAVMPGPDGYELCERVKLGGVPVVLLVGTFEPFNEAEARRVGADTVLTKPFQSIRDLVSKVGSLLGGESKHGDEQHSHADSHVADAQAQSNDEAARVAQAESLVEEPSHASDANESHDFGADVSSPYADLGADDELIEARPAEAFGAGGVFSEAEPEPFAARESHTSEELPTGERFGAREYEHAGAKNGHSAAAHAAPSSSSFISPSNYAEENPMPAQPSFEPRAASAAAADDTLLDLGQLEPHHGAASAVVADTDDFILDLDDEPLGAAGNFGDTPGLNDSFAAHDSFVEATRADAPSAFAEAAHGEQAASLSESSELFSEPSESSNESAEALTASAEIFSEPAVPFAASAHSFSEGASASLSSENESTFDMGGVEPSSFEHASHDASEPAGETAPEFVMQDGPQGFASYVAPHEVGAAPRGFVEPEVVPSDVPAPAVVEADFTDGSVEGDLSKAPAVASQTSASHGEPSTEGYAVVEGHTRVEEPVSADKLSQEAIDAIARRVVEMMSDKVVREIAWEVVPELAEMLIRQKLDEEKSR
jgi:CheY-like chemotaxis protein